MSFIIVLIVKSNCQRPVLCVVGCASSSLDSVSVHNPYKSDIVAIKTVVIETIKMLNYLLGEDNWDLFFFQ